MKHQTFFFFKFQVLKENISVFVIDVTWYFFFAIDQRGKKKEKERKRKFFYGVTAPLKSEREREREREERYEATSDCSREAVNERKKRKRGGGSLPDIRSLHFQIIPSVNVLHHCHLVTLRSYQVPTK